MNVERIVSSGTAARHSRMRCSVFASAAGRFIAFRIFGLACWNGTSRYGSTLPSAISGISSSTCGYGYT